MLNDYNREHDSHYEEEQDYGWNDHQGGSDQKALKGYRFAIIMLTVILAALSILYFSVYRQQQVDMELLTQDRNALQENLVAIVSDFDALKVDNEALADSLAVERHRADSIITQLKKERTFNYAKLKQYEREVGTLRAIMKGYLAQIDSLNTLNQKLISENVTYRKQITSAQLRAEMAEERAQELNTQIRKGAALNATKIGISPRNSRGNAVSRAKRAESLRVDFTLATNTLSDPGYRKIYLRLISPDGFILTTEQLPTFNFEGKTLTYSSVRDVDFQNEELPVSIFYNNEGFESGLYRVELYSQGFLIGAAEVDLK